MAKHERAVAPTDQKARPARVPARERRRNRSAIKAAKRAERARRRREGSGLGRRREELDSASYPGTATIRARRCAQEALGYDALHEDGLVRVCPGTYSRVVEFDDINFQSANQETQDWVFDRWRAVLNGLDPSVKVQVKLMCRVVGRQEFLDSMLMRPVEGDEVGNSLRHELNRIVEKKVSETRQNVERRRLAVLTVEGQEGPEEASVALAQAIEPFVRNLRGMGVRRVRQLDGDGVLAAIDSVTNPDDPRGLVSFDDLKATDAHGRPAYQLGYTTLDLVAPDDVMRPDAAHIQWGDCHGCAMFVEKWANTIRSNMLSSLAELPINQVITLDLRPWDPANAIDLVEGAYNDLKAQRNEYLRKHYDLAVLGEELLPSPLRDAIDNVGSLRDDLVQAESPELYFTVGVSVLAWGRDDDERDRAVRQVKDTMRKFGVRVAPMRTMQGQGFAAALPTGRWDIPYHRNMSTSPLAALMPFTSVEILEPGGMYMGQNVISKNFIFYDRARATSPNGFILGQLGHGKSVTAKSMILWTRLNYPDDPCYVIDPEDEYYLTVDRLGGLNMRICAGSPTHFNPLELVIDEDGPDSALALKSSMILSAVSMMADGITPIQKSLVSRCIRAIYARFVETRDPLDQPVWRDLYEQLKRQEEPEAAELATTIELYVLGEASFFNYRTNADIDNRLVCFNIRDNGRSFQPMVQLFVLDYVWQQVVRNRDLGLRTWIFIDEIQLLLENEYSLAYFRSLWSRSRKYGAIPTGITQNAAALLANEDTVDMISKSEFLVLLNQSSTDADAIGRERGLSESQVDYLKAADPGQGVICASGRTIQFENIIPEDTEIFRLVNTRPTEMVRQAAQPLDSLVAQTVSEVLSSRTDSPFADLSQALAGRGVSMSCVGASRTLVFTRGNESVTGEDVGYDVEMIARIAKRGARKQTD